MRRAVLAFAVGAWIALAGVLAFQAQEAADPVRLLQEQTDRLFTQDSASLAERGPVRNPEWDIPGVRRIEEDSVVVEEARACLRMYGEELKVPEVRRTWYMARRIVFVPPQSPAREYLGLTFTGPGGRKIIIVSESPRAGRKTLVHEAAHAVCEDDCPHARTQVASRCGWDSLSRSRDQE